MSSHEVDMNDDDTPAVAATAIRCAPERPEPARRRLRVCPALRSARHAAAPSPVSDSLASSSLFTPNWTIVMGAKEPTFMR